MACLRGTCSKSRRLTDRKSTRLNSSHQIISYAVFCLKKKNKSPVDLVFANYFVLPMTVATVSQKTPEYMNRHQGLLLINRDNHQPLPHLSHPHVTHTP